MEGRSTFQLKERGGQATLTNGLKADGEIRTGAFDKNFRGVRAPPDISMGFFDRSGMLAGGGDLAEAARCARVHKSFPFADDRKNEYFGIHTGKEQKIPGSLLKTWGGLPHKGGGNSTPRVKLSWFFLGCVGSAQISASLGGTSLGQTDLLNNS